MYKRYPSASPKPQNTPRPTNTHPKKAQTPTPQKEKNAEINNTSENKKFKTTVNSFTKYIPQTLYNSQTGKVLGILSTDDLFLIALIFLLLDGDDEDNSMLIIALIYILLSEHIDLPF